MVDMEALFRSVDDLSSEEVKHLYDYIVENRLSFTDVNAESTGKPRILGLHEHLGHAWMSEDFLAELPDEFWLGEE